MRWLRYFLLAPPIAVLALAAYSYFTGSLKFHGGPLPWTISYDLSPTEQRRLLPKTALAKQFTAAHGYNTRIAFLLDMSLASGKNRFFVADLEKDSILLAGLVAHGSGNKSFSVNPVFSNTHGSSCSALGKYKIGNFYTGQFGAAYKLHGLDPTNDQAFHRNIVLHAYDCVPEGETYPYPICNSRGCAMVSPAFLKRLQSLIDHSQQPILLWIFD